MPALNLMTKLKTMVAQLLIRKQSKSVAYPKITGSVTNKPKFSTKPVPSPEKSSWKEFAGNAFTAEGLKKHKSIFPLLFIIGGVILAVPLFMVAFVHTRSELQLSHYADGRTPGDSMDLANAPYNKFVDVRKKENRYVMNAELIELYKVMNEAALKLKEQGKERAD